MSRVQLMGDMEQDEWERRVGLLLAMVGSEWTELATWRFMSMCIRDAATLDEKGHIVLLDADVALAYFAATTPPS